MLAQRCAIPIHSKEVSVRNVSPSRIPVQALGGDDDRPWESLPALDEVQRIARTLCGVAGEGHRFAIGDAQVERGPHAALGTNPRDTANGLYGGLGQISGILPQPVEEPGEDRLGVRRAEETGVRLIAQSVVQGTHDGAAEILDGTVVREHKGARGEGWGSALLYGQPRRGAPDCGEDGPGSDPGR